MLAILLTIGIPVYAVFIHITLHLKQNYTLVLTGKGEKPNRDKKATTTLQMERKQVVLGIIDG